MTRRKMLSIEEVAEQLGVTDRTVRRYLAVGMLPGWKMGDRLVRIDPDDVDRLFQPLQPTAGPRARTG